MRPTLALLTLVMVLGVAGFGGGTGAAAETPAVGEPTMRVFGETFPTKLPRGRSTPTSLRVGFESETSESHTAPELSRISFEISKGVVFDPRGLPNCRIAKLYATYPKPRQACPGSFLGEGNVSSEIDLPGQETIFAAGRLYAFHSIVDGTPYVLAQVIVAEPVQIVYVIPFKIEKRHGSLATRLVVRRMRIIHGKCRVGGCGGSGYSLVGVYSKISFFEMFLDRALNGGASLIRGHCPLLGSGTGFPLVNTSLLYEGSGIELNGRRPGACQA